MFNLTNIDISKEYGSPAEEIAALKSYIYQLVEEVSFRLDDLDASRETKDQADANLQTAKEYSDSSATSALAAAETYTDSQFAQMDDYVVEQGSSGIWTYRKWASGMSECFGTYTASGVVCNSAWGNLYEAKVTDGIAFPSGLFAAIWSFNCTLTGLACMLETTNGVSTTSTPGLWAVRPNVNNAAAVNANMHAIGRWK